MDLPRYEEGPEDGREALLVHGLSSDAGGWWQTADHLIDRGWRVTRVDLRGHGAADRSSRYGVADYAADVRGTRPRRGDTWHLAVGHSLGGSSVLSAAESDPAWAERIVLLDPVLEIDEPGLAVIRDGIFDDLAGATAESLRSAHPRWDERDINAKLAALQRVEASTIAATVADPAHWQLVERAAAVGVPTLLLAADPALGGLLAPGVGDALARANPLVTAVTVEGAGHSIHRDDAAAFLRLLDGFLP